MLYVCSVADKVMTEPSEPRKVMVRMFGKIIGGNPDVVVTDQVVFALLAEKGLVPKLYGVFTDGRVEEYVEVCDYLLGLMHCLLQVKRVLALNVTI